MVAYQLEDKECPTVVCKRGDASFAPLPFLSLQEAVIAVARWPEAERAKAQFKMTGTDQNLIMDRHPVRSESKLRDLSGGFTGL